MRNITVCRVKSIERQKGELQGMSSPHLAVKYARPYATNFTRSCWCITRRTNNSRVDGRATETVTVSHYPTQSMTVSLTAAKTLS